MEVSRFCGVSGVSVLLASLAAVPGAAHIHFDTAPTVACRPLDDRSFLASNPGERLWEAKLSISTFLSDSGPLEAVEQGYLLRVLSADVFVHNYAPQTTLGSDYAGTIAQEEKVESSRSLGITIAGVQNCLVKATGSGDLSHKDAATRKYELVAPQETVVASGTLYRGRAVYFKLRPGNQMSLEGAKEFTVTLRAPANWRADGVLVRCQATARQRSRWPGGEESVAIGGTEFLVGLYAEGDAAARRAAEEVARADASLRRAVRAHLQSDRQRQDSSLLHQLTALMEPVPTRRAPLDMETLLFGTLRTARARLPDVPTGLRAPASEFLAARHRIESLRGGPAGGGPSPDRAQEVSLSAGGTGSGS